MSAPHQPWAAGAAGRPLTEEAMKALLDRAEERARAREERMKVFLAFLPLLWGGISFVLWLLYFLLVLRRD